MNAPGVIPEFGTPEYWEFAYGELRDAVAEHLGDCVKEDDVAEEAIVLDAIRTAGARLQERYAAGWAAGIEKAAQVCESRASSLFGQRPMRVGEGGEASKCASAIRQHRSAPAAAAIIDENGAEHSQPAWLWLDKLVQQGRGAVLLGYTENGDVGVFWPGHSCAQSLGGGDTAEEAVLNAMRHHPTPAPDVPPDLDEEAVRA